MAFVGRTPEQLIPRSDSRNPATTCKGITKNGRPCRRAIDAKVPHRSGVLAVVSVASDSDEEDTGAAAFFCWQHKDQAEQLASANNAAGSGGRDTQLYPLQERSSIDTLVARLGVLDVEEPAAAERKRRRQSRQEIRTSSNKPPRKINRPPTWDRVQGPLMSVPSDLMTDKNCIGQWQTTRPSQRKTPGFWESLCCGTAADEDDYVEVVRHKKRVNPTANQYSSEAPMQQMPQAPPRVYRDDKQSNGFPSATSSRPRPRPRPSSGVPDRKPLSDKPARPLNKASQNSETSNLLANIPKTLSPQTTSLLLTELSKPISQHDEEGYIYIFWLTPESLGPAPSSTASTLLAPPSRPEQGRRTSDVLRQYSVRNPSRPNTRPDAPRKKSDSSATDAADKNTILLKIGRANNVHRRMHEWTRQCGYSLSLVRFYPYVSSTPSPSPTPSPRGSPAHSRRQSYQNQRPADPIRKISEGVRKVPHAHRVERLVHIELAAQRVMKQCDACGKEHREWFEVEATRDGVKKVDEVVRRWVEWAESANAT